MISTMRPPYTGWNSSLVIPEYRYLANKLLFATEFGWDSEHKLRNGNTGPLDLISGKRAGDGGDNYASNNFAYDTFGKYLAFNEVTYGNGVQWTNAQRVAWWVDNRNDIPVSIESLVYIDSSVADTATNNRIIRFGATTGGVQLYLQWDTDHWEVVANRITTNSYQQARTQDPFPTDRWVHLVATIPAFGFGAPRIYIDAKLEQIGIVGTGTAIGTDREIRVSSPGGSDEFTGKMASLRAYRVVLTQDDVNKLYADPFGILRQSPRGFEWVERRPTIRVRARGRG